VHGRLALKGGILYVGRHTARAGFVRPFDLDGHALGPGFPVRGVDGGRASIAGLAVDDDHRIWVADAASRRVRAFSAFGRELAEFASRAPGDADRAGSLGSPVDVACSGVEDEARICVASGGTRRHALHLFDRHGERVLSLRPAGDPLGVFRGLTAVAVRDRTVWACERGAHRVQVFRDGEFHFLFGVDLGRLSSQAFEPRAIATLSDGRLVVAHGGAEGALLLLEREGRIARVLARGGPGSGEVFEPSGVVVDERDSEGSSRIAVIDSDGDRVQVFTLEGRCFGSFDGISSAVV
jgi:hypothetical protein